MASSSTARRLAPLVLAHAEAAGSRLLHASAAPGAPRCKTSADIIGLPTLGNVPVKLNSAKWAAPAAADASAMSIFDVKGAFATLSEPPDPTVLSAGMVALNARVARAQQQEAALFGIKVFPDLTPGRALMWGTILAVWGFATGTALAARALDINSVDDLRPKMQQHLQPIKEWSKQTLAFIPETFKVEEGSKSLGAMHDFASRVKRTLRGRGSFTRCAEDSAETYAA